MTISGRITLNNVVLLLLTVFVAITGATSVRRLEARLHDMNALHVPAASILVNLDKDLHKAFLAERTILSTENPSEAERWENVHRNAITSAQGLWVEYVELMGSSTPKSLAESFETALSEWLNVSGRIFVLIEKTTPASRAKATELSLGDSSDAFDMASAIVRELASLAEDEASSVSASGTGIMRTAMASFVFISCIGVLIGAGFSWVTIKSTTFPIKKLVEALTLATEAEGDLTVILEESRNDEITEVARLFNSFTGKLRDTVSRVSEATGKVAETSQALSEGAEDSSLITSQIAHAIGQIAAGSQDQSESAGKTATAVDHLTEAISQVARGTEKQMEGVQTAMTTAMDSDRALDETLSMLKKTGLAAEKNASFATGGSECVRNVLESIGRIGDSAGNIVERITELDKHSRDISGIVEVISSIATQTNLLALNAAIEAARAGEHGKGFAVVSEEIRKLAEESSRETKAIAKLIESIRQATEKAVSAAKSGASEVEAGTVLAREASEALSNIAQGAAETQELVVTLAQSTKTVVGSSKTTQDAMATIVKIAQENANAAERMMISAGEVRRLIDSVAAVSEENAAATEEVSASAEDMNSSIRQIAVSAQTLSELAHSLRATVNRFGT